MSIIALFIVLLVSISANNTIAQKAAIGLKAPDVTLYGLDSRQIDLASLRGHYCLVHFWSANDAQSRIEAINLDRFAAANEERLNLLSINIDENQRLVREIVRIDGLDEATQFYAGSSATSVMIKKYGLSRGLKTFLIAPDGTIEAVNPTSKTLAEVIDL